jgi:hypothetical protein
MITKLERENVLAMSFSLVTCVLMGISALFKINGLFDVSYESSGIKLFLISVIFQLLIFLFWIHEIILSKLRLVENWDIRVLMDSPFNNIEKTVIIYFILFLLVVIGITLSNTLTKGETWLNSTEQNLISLCYCQLVIITLIITIPMRW